MADSINYYTTPEQRDNNIFVEEYYASPDISIRFDDKDQTEVSYLGYSMQEQLLPIYAYGSRTFDDVAVGNRLVNGVFKVPIKNPNAAASYEAITGDRSITAFSPLEKIAAYNEQVTRTYESVEWADAANVKVASEASFTTSTVAREEILVYSERLKLLGYCMQSYTTETPELKAAIKAFQTKQTISVTGKLDETTKSAINASFEVEQGGAQLIEDAILYTCPVDADVTDKALIKGSLTAGTKVKVISAAFTNCVYVTTANQTQAGYVLKKRMKG